MQDDQSPVAEEGNMLHGAGGGRLKELFDDLPAAVVVLTGPDHVFQYFNRSYAALFSSEPEVLGRPLRECLPDIAAQGYADLLDKVYATGDPYRGSQVPITLRDVGLRYFDFVYLATRNEAGAIDGILAHGVDVTDVVTARLRAEELSQQLQRERAQLATVIEHIPVGVVIADTSAKILSANSAYYRSFDVPANEVNDLAAWHRFQGYRPDGTAYQPHEYPLVRTVTSGEEVTGELVVIRRRGERDRVLELSSAPIFDDDQSLVSGVAVFSDVTDRLARQAATATRRALDQAQIRLDKVLDAAGDGILVLDLIGNISLANPSAQEMTGYSADELLGRAVHLVLHHSRPDGSPYPAEECPILHSAERGQERRVEDDYFWRSDGTAFPVSYQSTPIYEDDQQIGSVLVFRDLTEGRRAELARGAAREAELSQRQALELNDDIMQGLTVIQLSLEMGRPADAKEAVASTIQSMKAMINRLLDSADSDDLSATGALTRDRPASFANDSSSGVRQ